MFALLAQTATAIETAAAANVDIGLRGQFIAGLATLLSAVVIIAGLWIRARGDTLLERERAAKLTARAETLEAEARVARAEAAVRSAVSGVESSKLDVKDVLAAAIPRLPAVDVDALVKRVHDAVTKRIERTSAGNGTEATLGPIVKETKAAMRAVDENGNAAIP